MPLYTAALLLLNSHLPRAIGWVLEAVFFFGSPLMWANVALYGPLSPPPDFYQHAAFYSLLGGFFGFVFWKRFAADIRSAFIQSCRLAVFSWAVVAGIAVLALGYMAASGVH